MPELRTMEHLSHSSRETLQRCAKSWFLKYMAQAPKRPALWLAGGSAVHETTEFYDLQQVAMGGKPKPWSETTVRRLFNQIFDTQLGKAREAEPNENVWAKSQAEPIAVWRTNGAQFVQAYIDWRIRSPWEIWAADDGQPAIELDVSGRLPGCPVEIKGYIDRIFWDPVFKKHHIVDLKTGKNPPKNADQFGAYRALTEVKHGITADSGVPFMNRKGGLGKPHDLTAYTPEFVGDVFGKAWDEIQEYTRTGQWPATPGDCFICDVQSSCAAVGGPLAPQFDPASPGYIPF